MINRRKQLQTAALLSLLSLSSACTVLELQGDGFATNAMYLLHAIPIFFKQNGTLFIDSSAFPYSCNEGGGFMDFFKYEEFFVPWSPAKESAAGQKCRRITFAELDDIVYTQLKLPLYHLDMIGIQKAWWYKKWVWQWIEEKRLADLRNVASPTVAFHVRGGDIFEADKALGRRTTLPADYIQAFHKTHPHVKGGTCIFSGDEVQLLEQAAEIAEQNLKCTAVFGSVPLFKEGYSRARFSALDANSTIESCLPASNGTARRLSSRPYVQDLSACPVGDAFDLFRHIHVHNCEVKSELANFGRPGSAGKGGLLCRCKASLQILGDLEVLARADYFVGSYHSKWARLVEWLRYGLYQKDRSSSVDASADHADLFTIIYSLFHSKTRPAPVAATRHAQAIEAVSKDNAPGAEAAGAAAEGLHKAPPAHKGDQKGPSTSKAPASWASNAPVKGKGGEKVKTGSKHEEHPIQVAPKGSSKGEKVTSGYQEQAQRKQRPDELPLLADELPLEIDEGIFECLGLNCADEEASEVEQRG